MFSKWLFVFYLSFLVLTITFFINLNPFEDVAARTVAASDESAMLVLREKGFLQDQKLCEKCEDPMR